MSFLNLLAATPIEEFAMQPTHLGQDQLSFGGAV